MTTPTAATVLRPLGPLGRLGLWAARRRRLVFVSWAVLIVALGAVAPRAEHALSGGGWQADGSESVRARELIDRHFGGQGSYALAVVVSSPSHDRRPALSARRRAQRAGAVRTSRTSRCAPAAPGDSSRADGHVAVVRGGAGADTAEMVRAASRVQRRLEAAARPGVELSLTGSPALWSQFNEENKAAMLRSEVMSWPVTLAVLLSRSARLRRRDPAAARDPRARGNGRRAVDRHAASPGSRSGR